MYVPLDYGFKESITVNLCRSYQPTIDPGTDVAEFGFHLLKLDECSLAAGVFDR